MISDIIEQESYKELIDSQIKDIIEYLIDNSEEFAITANLEAMEFTPELPQNIKSQLSKFSLYVLANYTYTTIEIIDDNKLTFEAGFGSENFGSKVTLPLHSIFQIIIDDAILYLNPLATVDKFNTSSKEKSLNVFKNNPKNKNLIK
ncbi:hypothetical protein CP960_00550 [Malaciobacter halophilus]|uniref:Stringent starvation protein B n=1 Tax=Malaciobacter halophilus TaxID=197482 RepID=A0A2N1J6F2_9BACT|nr:hypothetical protein [Malaciobacter halophilus]AXH10683.1 hypothetical protein AHALO_2353 [Malaciobacter halophilus]PKI82157.1 hypothetical protein CP960_00550 [Malaciobacter halophilus]